MDDMFKFDIEPKEVEVKQQPEQQITNAPVVMIKLEEDGIIHEVIKRYFHDEQGLDSKDNLKYSVLGVALDNMDARSILEDINLVKRKVNETINSVSFIHKIKQHQVHANEISPAMIERVLMNASVIETIGAKISVGVAKELRLKASDPSLDVKERKIYLDMLNNLKVDQATQRYSHIHVVFMPPIDIAIHEFQKYGKWDEMKALLEQAKRIQLDIFEKREREEL